jgi:hypothetical protein
LTLYLNAFQSRKAALRIVIFGSYTRILRLEQLRECLKEDGYSANLVKDMKYPPKNEGESEDVYNVRASFYWLENSGANFLVFFRDVSNEGVAMELGEVCSTYPKKLPSTRIFFDRGPSSFSSMIRGRIEGKKIIHTNFSTDKNLCEFAKAAALDVLTSI